MAVELLFFPLSFSVSSLFFSVCFMFPFLSLPASLIFKLLFFNHSYYFAFWDKVSLCHPGWPEIYHVSQVVFKFVTNLPQSSKYQNYKGESPILAPCSISFSSVQPLSVSASMNEAAPTPAQLAPQKPAALQVCQSGGGFALRNKYMRCVLHTCMFIW